MFKAAGSEVLYLKRLSMGQLQLDETLEPGMFRPLTGSEINLLKAGINICVCVHLTQINQISVRYIAVILH